MEQTRRTRAPDRASREAFITATGRLLRRQGYAATGLSEIVSASGAPRGSLYFHFPGGKEELAAAAMERTGEDLRAAIAAVVAAHPRASESLSALIDGLGAGLEASGFRDGCPIATITLEASGSSETVRLAAERVFAAWLGALQEGLRADGLDSVQAARRALLVLSAIEGALLLSRARRDLVALEAVRDELAALACALA